MADTPGDPSGGGSFTPDSGVCSITPSDLVGYTGNALNRIAELEQRVTELETKIVQANQLSDISGQIGWIDGITFMGVSGWTQTEYGSLIPPVGWSLMDSGLIPTITGTGMQLVYTDADGNLLSLADSVVQDYAIVAAGTQITAGGESIYPASRGVTISANTMSTGATSGYVTFTTSREGVYHVIGQANWNSSGHNPAIADAVLTLGEISAGGPGSDYQIRGYNKNLQIQFIGSAMLASGGPIREGTSAEFYNTVSGLYRLDAGFTATVTLSVLGVPNLTAWTNTNFNGWNVSIHRVTTGAA